MLYHPKKNPSLTWVQITLVLTHILIATAIPKSKISVGGWNRRYQG